MQFLLFWLYCTGVSISKPVSAYTQTQYIHLFTLNRNLSTSLVQDRLCSATAYVKPDDVQGRGTHGADGRAAETATPVNGLGSMAVLKSL